MCIILTHFIVKIGPIQNFDPGYVSAGVVWKYRADIEKSVEI